MLHNVITMPSIFPETIIYLPSLSVNYERCSNDTFCDIQVAMPLLWPDL